MVVWIVRRQPDPSRDTVSLAEQLARAGARLISNDPEMMRLRDRLEDLRGLPVWGVHLAADMLTLQLGEPRTVILARGPRVVGQCAFHVQCEWAWSRGGEHLVSRSDIRMLAQPDRVRLLGERLGILVPADPVPHGPVVTDVGMRSSLALQVVFSADLRLSAEPDSGLALADDEHWRLLIPGAEHYVVQRDRVAVDGP